MAAPADGSAGDAQRAVADLAEKIDALYRVNFEIATRIDSLVASQSLFIPLVSAKDLGSEEVEAVLGGRNEGREQLMLFHLQPGARGEWGDPVVRPSVALDKAALLQPFSESSVVQDMRRPVAFHYSLACRDFHQAIRWNKAMHSTSKALLRLHCNVALPDLRVCLANLEALHVSLGAQETALLAADDPRCLEEAASLVRELNVLVAALQAQARPGHEVLLPLSERDVCRDVWDLHALPSDQRRLLSLDGRGTVCCNAPQLHTTAHVCGMIPAKTGQVQWQLSWWAHCESIDLGIASEADLSTPVVSWRVSGWGVTMVTLTVNTERRIVCAKLPHGEEQRELPTGTGAFRVYVGLRSSVGYVSIADSRYTVAPAAEEAAPESEPRPVSGVKRACPSDDAM